MINKILTYVIFISFFGMIGGTIGTFIINKPLTEITNIAYSIFIIASIIILTINGDFIKTKELKLSIFGVLLALIGLWFKYMEFPYASLLLVIGFLFPMFFYALYLFRYKKSHWLYAVKLLFLICFLGSELLALLDDFFAKKFEAVSLGLLIFLVLVYFIQQNLSSNKLKK